MNTIDITSPSALLAHRGEGCPCQWDVRSPGELASGHVPGAVNIPMDQIEARLDDLLPGFYAAMYLRKHKLADQGTRVRVTADKRKDPARLDDFRINLDVLPISIVSMGRGWSMPFIAA